MNQAEAGVGMAVGQAQRESGQPRAHKVPWGAVPLPAASVGALTHAPGGGDQEVGTPHSVPDAATSHLSPVPYSECVSSWQSDKRLKVVPKTNWSVF